MRGLVERAVSAGVEVMAFGDLFLEDIRRYREENLAGTGLSPVFPLWQIPTAELARDMLRGGVEAFITCVDPRQAPRELAGRRWDEDALGMLPAAADPCGENGEFHTFVAAGPMFSRRIPVRPGPVVERDGFVFADLTPASS
jgi:diphthamide synthase (EF-2-diphthine--ammonia ligase)